MAEDMKGRWALVTGASAGIGEAFAVELARRGYAVVLTARRADRLEALAATLRAKYGVESRAIACDLADPAAPERLFRETESAGIAIDFLVNNAGYGVPGSLVSQPWDKHRDFIQVLMTAPVELCYRYLPGMRERRAGHIVNVASLAGHVPGSAGHTLYGASKAFLVRFSQSLALESLGHDVHVTAVCPGFTYSEFHDVVGSRGIVSKMPKFMWMSAEEVARQGLDASLRGDIVYVNGRVNRFIKSFMKVLPDPLALAVMKRQSRRFRAASD